MDRFLERSAYLMTKGTNKTNCTESCDCSCSEVLQGDLRWLTRLGGELTTPRTYLDELFALAREAIAMVDGDGHLTRFNGEFSRIDEVQNMIAPRSFVPLRPVAELCGVMIRRQWQEAWFSGLIVWYLTFSPSLCQLR